MRALALLLAILLGSTVGLAIKWLPSPDLSNPDVAAQNFWNAYVPILNGEKYASAAKMVKRKFFSARLAQAMKDDQLIKDVKAQQAAAQAWSQQAGGRYMDLRQMGAAKLSGDGKASVRVEFRAGQRLRVMELWLIREGGKWRIDEIRQ